MAPQSTSPTVARNAEEANHNRIVSALDIEQRHMAPAGDTDRVGADEPTSPARTDRAVRRIGTHIRSGQRCGHRPRPTRRRAHRPPPDLASPPGAAVRPGRWVAIDNGSLNGVFVNGRRVPAIDITDGRTSISATRRATADLEVATALGGIAADHPCPSRRAQRGLAHLATADAATIDAAWARRGPRPATRRPLISRSLFVRRTCRAGHSSRHARRRTGRSPRRTSSGQPRSAPRPRRAPATRATSPPAC